MVGTPLKTERRLVCKEKEKKAAAGCERSGLSALQHLPDGSSWSFFMGLFLLL